MCTILWRIHFFSKCLVCLLLFVCLVFGQTSTTVNPTSTPAVTTTESDICTDPAAPRCNATYIALTSVNITCDLSQISASSCPLEDLTILCKAVEESNQNFTWIVRERNFTTDVSTNSSYNSTHLLVTIDELSEFTNYSCKVALNNGTSDYSFVNFTTLEGVPSAPQNLTMTEKSQNNFTISWIEPVKIPGILLNYQINIQTLSANHQILENCTDPDYKVNKTIDVFTNATYTYTSAFPDVNYNVSVLGITSSGNGETATVHVTTESSAPEVPRELQCVSLESDNSANYTVKFWVATSWAPPCNTNGKEGNFSLVLNGYYTENSTLIDERNVTVGFIDGQTNYSFSIMDLKPSFQYELIIYLAGENGLQGKTANCSFSTNDTYPAPPTLNSITNITSSSFDISWDQLQGTAGRILGYNVTITSNGPLYDPPSADCNNDVAIRRTYYVDADTNFNFTEGKPYYNYTVYVTANTSRGYGPASNELSVTTNTSTPDPVNNLTANYTDHSNQTILDCNLILTASWELPCDVNGVFDKYYLTLTGTYSEDQNFTKSTVEEIITESTYQMELNASTNYNLTVEISLTDGTVGQPAWQEFTTPSCYSAAPILQNLEVKAKSFNISWLPPSENRGKVHNYYLNLTKFGPVMTYRDDCIYESGFEVYNISQQMAFRYENAVPFSQYQIQIFGETAKGNGSMNTTTITTSDSVPENVVNRTYSITMSNNTTYNSSAHINFSPPCFTNGAFQNYFVSFLGIRENYPNHINNESLVRTNYDFALRPDHNYSVIIAIQTVSYSNSSPAIEFNSPSGVPQFSSNTTLPVPSIADENTATVSLKRSHFDETNGEIKYIALIISDANVTGGDYNEWTDKNQWPVPSSSGATVYYQANEKYWMPFSDSVSEVDFVIGNDTTCTETQFCNRALNESTTYYLIIRVFTDNFYKNSWPIDFTTASTNRLVKILVPIFLLLFLAICLWILFVLWHKKKIRCTSFRFAEKIYARHTSAKPPCEPTTEVPLNKFVNYCKHLENNPEKLKSQYQLLGEKTKEITAEHTTVYALLPENRRKNRYTNILPYDETRVKLFMDEDDDLATDYINASYIRGFSGSIQYIASQGPLPDTCRDFWKMVLQENVSMIVMVSNFIENNKIKCYQYFPNNREHMMLGDDIEVRCSTELHFGTYCVRTLQVKRDLKQLHVTHLQFLDWPDFGVPQGTENMLQFCYQFQERQRLEGGCVVVHCSAGVGRTGTMIATDILLRQIKAGKKNVDVFKTVLDLRLQRVNMVQTEGQYMYIHSLIKDNLLEDPETKERIESGHPVLYENISSASQDSMGIVHMESKF